MNRRRFLKYAGATAAVVGASALGLDYLVRNPQIPSQQVTSSLATASVSSSSTQLVSLQGRLFFDYNGNGIQDGDEPSVQNARVQMQDNRAQVIAEVLTDSFGDYNVDIPAGNFKLNIQPDSSFRYMCRSPNEFRTVQDGYDLAVVGPGTFDIGLMEGWLTQPVTHDTDFGIFQFYDRDPDPTKYLWWNGQHGLVGPKGFSPNHPGIDYSMELRTTGSDVIAPAPGLIYGSQQLGPQDK